jgi:ketoreductase RED1
MPKPGSNEKAGAVLARYPEVAVVGAGLIGLSWAALFLANGLRVRVYDPRPELELAVRQALADVSPALRQLGFETAGFEQRLRIEPDLEAATRDADLVQESGPEQIGFKRECFARLEQFVKPNALLFSSTSSLQATQIAREMKDPGRMMVAHPFNPPHVMPLVEIVPGQGTNSEAVQEAVAFFRALGKAPVVLHREINGFVGNRLQAAVLRESMYLVQRPWDRSRVFIWAADLGGSRTSSPTWGRSSKACSTSWARCASPRKPSRSWRSRRKQPTAPCPIRAWPLSATANSSASCKATPP